MLKKIFAAKRILALAAASLIMLSISGCSKEYTMTEEDLALQEALLGFWAADNSTGYNEFDENGNLTAMTAVQFTDDFHYLLYYYYPNVTNDPDEPSYVMTNPPVSYTIKDGKFCVKVNGLDSYAGINISSDGYTMNWITDESTDKYLKFSAEQAAELGFPEYNAEEWEKIREMDEMAENGETEDNAADDVVTEEQNDG